MMHHAVRLASRGQRQLSRVTSVPFTTASPCSNLRTPLPGAYREPTELWHNDSAADGPSGVEVSVVVVVVLLCVFFLSDGKIERYVSYH